MKALHRLLPAQARPTYVGGRARTTLGPAHCSPTSSDLFQLSVSFFGFIQESAFTQRTCEELQLNMRFSSWHDPIRPRSPPSPPLQIFPRHSLSLSLSVGNPKRRSRVPGNSNQMLLRSPPWLLQQQGSTISFPHPPFLLILSFMS